MQLPHSFGEVPPGTSPDAQGAGWWSNLTNLLTMGLSTYGQVRLQDLQMDLIKSGRPPLSAQQVAAMAPQLNVGLAPDLQQNLLKTALLGGAAVLAVVMLTKANRGR